MIAANWSPPHGGADRNTQTPDCSATISGRPLTGVRIETASILRAWKRATVAPSRGCGSKQGP